MSKDIAPPSSPPTQKQRKRWRQKMRQNARKQSIVPPTTTSELREALKDKMLRLKMLRARS